MVSAGPDVSNGSLWAWAYFYAGGKALDSLYDAKVMIENEALSFTDGYASFDRSKR